MVINQETVFYAVTMSQCTQMPEVKHKSASSRLESCFVSSKFFQRAIKDAEHMLCGVLTLGTKFFFPSGERWKCLEPLLRRKEQPTRRYMSEDWKRLDLFCHLWNEAGSNFSAPWFSVMVSSEGWVPVNDRFCLQSQPGRWCIPGIWSHRDCLMWIGLPEKAFVGFLWPKAS